jgi:hypothetical protein
MRFGRGYNIHNLKNGEGHEQDLNELASKLYITLFYEKQFSNEFVNNKIQIELWGSY